MIFSTLCISAQDVFIDSVLKKKALPINMSDSSKVREVMLNYEKMKDTVKVRKNTSGLDSIVVYTAKDSVRFNVKQKVMRLRGQAKLDYKVQKLESEIMIMYFNDNTLEATGAKDTSGKGYGFPNFADKSENFIGEKILYNFKSSQGTISLGETKISDGFYFGDKIKRVSQDEMFVAGGKYTTCSEPEPHYHFGSPEMKIIAKDRVMLDPLIFYVEGMPIFILPVGIFFPNKSGRQSGLVIPSFFFSANRGVTFENFGLYLALSDYYDTKFLANFYSKGGFTLKNYTQWKLLDVFDGNVDLQYGKTRFNVDNEYSTNWSVRFRHNHILSPQSNFVANLSFMSQDFNRNTSPNLRDRVQQDMTSNASYSKSFDNGSSISLGYTRSQNILTDEYTQSPSFSYSMPQWYLLKPLVSANSWLRDVNVSYSGNASYNHNKYLKYETVKLTDTTSRQDTSFDYRYAAKISHNPSISISPKFGHFTVSPSIGFRASNYFRRITRFMDASDSSLKDVEERGFFTEYGYNFGVTVSTRLYGIMKPKIFGINAIRHTLQPSFGFSYTPDQSDESLGFYGKYTNLHDSSIVRYSRYVLDGGGVASSYRSQSINYNFNNNFGAKLAQNDTAEKTVDLFSFTFGGAYNFVADSLKFSDINLSFHTPSIGNISFNGNAGFTLYDEGKIFNPVTKLMTDNYHRIDQFLLSNGKGLARLTNFSLSLSTSFGSSGNETGIQSQSLFGDTTAASPTDTAALGERFSKRMNAKESKFDFFGDCSPGYSKPSFPWNLSLSLNFQYNQPLINQITRSINVNAVFNVKLTESWSLDGSAQLDFERKELVAPSLNIRKDLHCWDLIFTWYPIGYSKGYYLRFGIKAPQLKDLKLEKRNNPIY